MRHRLWQRSFQTIHFTVSFLLLLIACRSGAQDFQTGVRAGFSLDSAASRFDEGEGFVRMKFPKRWDFYSDWNLRVDLDASAGWIGGHNANGFIATLGPVLELAKGTFPVFLEAGPSPTVLSQYRYGS